MCFLQSAGAFLTARRPSLQYITHLERIPVQHGTTMGKNEVLTEVLSGFWDQVGIKREDNASNRLTTDGDIEISYRSI